MTEHFNEHRQRWEPVRRFKYIAHDLTIVIIWDVSLAQADLRFEKTKWKGRARVRTELRPDEECIGK